MKLALVALLVASPLAAQDALPIDAPMPLTVPLSIDARLVPSAMAERKQLATSAESAHEQPRKRRGRYGAGLLGFAVGAGAGIGVAAAAGPYDDCACEDPGLKQGIIGVAVGGILGAGIGAALPASDVAGCSRRDRIAPGILGALVSSAVFAGVGALVDPVVGVFLVPFSAPFGAAYALKRCR
jgi:hypothetical protein